MTRVISVTWTLADPDAPQNFVLRDHAELMSTTCAKSVIEAEAATLLRHISGFERVDAVEHGRSVTGAFRFARAVEPAAVLDVLTEMQNARRGFVTDADPEITGVLDL